MNLHITDQTLTLQMDWHERLWAFHLSSAIAIPRSEIQTVSTDPPKMEWYALRAPGTALPGFFVAGTYYTPRGREFWYVTRNKPFLVLTLTDHYYKRIVLTLDDSAIWAARLAQSH